MNTSNDIFSLPRFVAFAKKEFTEQRRQLLLQLGTLLGAITFTGLAMCYGIYESEWARAATLQCDPMAFSLTNGVLERNWVRLLGSWPRHCFLPSDRAPGKLTVLMSQH